MRFVQVWSGADNGFPRRNWDSHEDIANDHGDMGASMDRPAAALDQGPESPRPARRHASSSGRPSSAACRAARAKGRDHNPFTFTSWLAGGGIKGGTIYGASDEWSYKAVDEPDLLLRPARHGPAPAGHRSREADVPLQRHRPPADRRARARHSPVAGVNRRDDPCAIARLRRTRRAARAP